MTKGEQDPRRTRLVRRIAAIGAAAAAAAVLVAAVLGTVSSPPASLRGTRDASQGPASQRAALQTAASQTASSQAAASQGAAGTSSTGQAAGLPAGGTGTPAGWAPVPYQLAQLSVPGMWLVEGPGQVFCAPQPSGMIFVGSKPRIPKGTGCGLTASLAWIRPAGHIPPGIRHRRPTAVIHGIPVYRLPSGPGSVVYLVPELKVRVGARGPLTRRVLATLTWSPLSVVLRRGPAAPVPAGWIWHQFGGVSFAAPPSWSLQRENQWATCGTGLTPGTLLLIDATKPPLSLPCPFSFPAAAAEQARPGLTAVTGRYAAKSVGQDFARCEVRSGVRVCLSSVTGQGGFSGGVLIFSVSLPRGHGTAFFLLGLSGSGASARAVFDSIRA